MLLPTLACQASCHYCFAHKTGGPVSDAVTDAALSFIARIAPPDRDFHLTFHGGEPLLAGEAYYTRILPQISERFGRRAHLSIQSNLWAMTDALAELFARFRVSVGTSLDGPKDMCDAQRGKGYYEKTAAGMELLRKHGITAGPICTFTGINAGRAAEVFRYFEHPYAIHGAVAQLGSSGGEDAVSPQRMRQILLDSYEAYRRDPAHNRITTIDAIARSIYENRGVSCTWFDCLGVFAAIDPAGDVYSCQRFCGMKEYSLGNVLESLTEEEILQSPGYARLRKVQDKKKSAFGDCSHWDYCMGGCLYSSLAAGTPKDPCCEAYRAAFDLIGRDMALEMGNSMLGRDGDTPVLAMAGDRIHPFDLRCSRERMRTALEKGRSAEGFAGRLRSRWPEKDLNKLYLHVTFDCPLRCSHCYASGGEAPCPELEPERLAEILQEAADLQFRSVVITGGEPLVYRGFDELCARIAGISRKGMKLILRTSFGFPVPQERLERICRLFDEIVVSVDGSQDSHDARRGPGRYAQTVRNLEAAAKDHSGKLALAATMTRRDADGLPGRNVRMLADRLHIEKVRFRPVLPLGRGKASPQEPWQLLAEEMIDDCRFYPRHSCGLGQNLYVCPDGRAYPCYAWCAPEKQLGDLSSESLKDMLDRGGLYAYCSHDVDTNEKCRACEVRYLCGGICKAWVRDRQNVDSGDFDCTQRRLFFERIARELDETRG